MYLAAIIALYSRTVLSWLISNTMGAEFCVAAVEEVTTICSVPATFNTDQGSQFTSEAFVGVLEAHGIRISMDGRNRAFDNIFAEGFWRSLKYQDIYFKDYQTMEELKQGLKRYHGSCYEEREHELLAVA